LVLSSVPLPIRFQALLNGPGRHWSQDYLASESLTEFQAYFHLSEWSSVEREEDWMQMIRGSRLLNDNGPVLGLNAYDLMGAIVLLVTLAQLLAGTGLEFVALPVAAIVLIAMIPLRLRRRRGILRDTIRFWCRRTVGRGRIHVPKQLT
jgi:hypothetical protein